MPCPWMYLRAQPNSAIQNLTASSVNVFLEIWNRKSPPLIRSTTRYLHRQISAIPLGKEAPERESSGNDVHILYVLEAVAQVANERVVDMFEHTTFSDDIPHTFGPYNWSREQDVSRLYDLARVFRSRGIPSSFLIYFKANDKPVSFLSTMRTLPNAPRPTTRKRRK